MLHFSTKIGDTDSKNGNYQQTCKLNTPVSNKRWTQMNENKSNVNTTVIRFLRTIE